MSKSPLTDQEMAFGFERKELLFLSNLANSSRSGLIEYYIETNFFYMPLVNNVKI